ncbi:hypothetical protein ACWD4J_30285 [Streptomyces sp. NPDC002577]
MTIRGKVTAALVCALTASTLLSACSNTPKPPTSEEIKASAQARVDASLKAGREAREIAVDSAYTPSDELCQAVWDRKTKTEQQALSQSIWMHGCADAPAK